MVNKRYEPRYLNAQISDGLLKGKTEMHLAAHTTNAAAVRYLPDEEMESQDLTLLHDDGYSTSASQPWN